MAYLIGLPFPFLKDHKFQKLGWFSEVASFRVALRESSNLGPRKTSRDCFLLLLLVVAVGP